MRSGFLGIFAASRAATYSESPLLIESRMRRTPAFVLPLVCSTLIVGCAGSTDPGTGRPAQIIIVSGNNQEAIAGATLPAPIVVKVLDGHGQPMPDAGIEFRVTSGGGHLTAESSVTDAQGIAGAIWTLGGSTAAPQHVTVMFLNPVTGEPFDSALFRATARPGPVSRIFAIGGDGQYGFERQPLTDSLVVLTTDIYGNPVPNVPVTFTVTSGGGSVSPSTATSDVNGRAATAFTLGAYGAQQSVRASAAGGAYTFIAFARRAPDGTSIALSGRPYALAVSSHDVVYVGRVDAGVLTRFDGSSTAVTATVSVGSTPTEIAFNASGTKAYVTNQFSDNVGVIDVARNVQAETIPVTGDPFQVIVSPDETRIYVTTNADQVYAINLATKTVVGQTPTGATANGLAINADGSRLYVSTRAGGSVMEVNTATMTVVRTFNPGGTTQAVVVAPDGAEVYVVNEQGFLYAYNLATGALAWTVDLGGSGPFGMALTPNGTELYITVMWTGSVKVVNRATHSITRTYFVDGVPRRIGITSDGTAVVANESGWVTWLK